MLRQCAGLLQLHGQLIGGDDQRESEKDTQCFHAHTIAFSCFKKIGGWPILASVFG
jgi:hypothetical protein